MRILIASSNTNHNWGDASMLEVALRRLSRHFLKTHITLLNHRSDALNERFPRAHQREAECRSWQRDRELWGRIKQTAPLVVDRLYMRWPRMWEHVTGLKMQLMGRDVTVRSAFLEDVCRADLLVVSGGGFITDLFGAAGYKLSLIQLAYTRDVPVVMFGQGIGPIRDPHLFKRARFTLPKVDLIALREERFSPSLLRKLGVPDEKMVITGDDAVALAYPERPDALGHGIGVNLRVASYSNVQDATTSEMAEVLHEASQALDAPLRPVPIAFEGHGSDVDTIRQILHQCGVTSDGGASLNSPRAVIRQAGRCRVVVTGSYHGGVFALSQGVPVVALSRSEYYDQKFHGLADQFGGGCIVLRTDRTDFKPALRQALYATWERAETTRPALLEAAGRQIEAAEAAYVRAARIIEQKTNFERDVRSTAPCREEVSE